jgi:putative transposase
VHKLLEQIVKCKSNPAVLVDRAKLILELLKGANNTKTSHALGLHRDTARYWRGGWLANTYHLAQAESLISLEDEATLMEVVEQILKDAQRNGGPCKFKPEEIVQIIAIACEEPKASGYPISHWTPQAIAREAVKREIVSSISIRQVGRFLKALPKSSLT